MRAAEAEIAATPELNPCKHVYLLESIRGIREDARRFKMLQDFLTTYQSGQRGNWIICGSCDKTLVCRHELMLLNEYLNPGRSVALHKALLLEFGGPVFEGAYICKNCGQKISEIEYDTHLEYTDDGTPMVGRTVVDKTEETEEIDLAVPLESDAAVADAVKYDGEDAKLFLQIRTVLEHCGITPLQELYNRLIPAARDFKKEKVPSQEVYDQRRAKAIAEKAKVVLPPYAVYDANSRVGVLGALVVLELLTKDLAIPFPARGCKFERGGFPLDKDGTGTLSYVACVLAGILRNDAPWNAVAWAAETSIPKRQTATEMVIRQTMNLLLAIPGPTGIAPAPLTTVTDYYKTALADVRAEASATDEGAGLASRADQLTGTFRPIPFLKSTAKEGTSVPNASKLKKDVTDGPIEEVRGYVEGRMQEIAHQVITEFHTSSLSSAKSLHVLSEGNPRSEAVCCFRRLGSVEIDGLGAASLEEKMGEAAYAELALVKQASEDVGRRDPTRSANGTHFFVPWSAPPQSVFQPQADASMYYRLFLKHCFRGPNMGSVHEFGNTSVCRFCEFEIPAELTFLTASNIAETDMKKLEKAIGEQAVQRKELALAAFQAQGVAINDQTFQELEEAIKMRRIVYPPVLQQNQPLPQLLQSMLGVLRESGLLSTAQQDWAILQQAVDSQIANQIHESARRRQLYSAFSRRQDELLQAVELRLIELLGPRPPAAARASIRKALDGFLRITEPVEGAAGARACIQQIVVVAEKVAAAFTVKKPSVNKWFPKVSANHRELLYSIWEKLGEGVDKGLQTLEDLSAATKSRVQMVLTRLVGWLGPWLRLWITDLRPSNGPEAFTVSELQMILRWSILQFAAALLTDQSVLYASATVDVRDGAIRFFHGWILDTFINAVSLTDKYDKSEREIQDEILARKELEKASFIKKMDVLDKDLRKVELIKKKLKIGDWAVGTMKNLFNYDADFYEFQRGQRAAMGLPEFDATVTGDGGAARENPYGFMDFGARMLGTEDHRVVHDEDAT
jgi:hypothetical protein